MICKSKNLQWGEKNVFIMFFEIRISSYKTIKKSSSFLPWERIFSYPLQINKRSFLCLHILKFDISWAHQAKIGLISVFLLAIKQTLDWISVFVRKCQNNSGF